MLAQLEAKQLTEKTIVIVSADHGENLGELNIYGDHQTADHTTCRVPYLLHWPGMTDADRPGASFSGKIYAGDVFATLIAKLGGSVPGNWTFRGFAEDDPREWQREWLVTSQMAWTCQRGVFFENFLYLRTYHDGWHNFPDEMLFDLSNDPHETRDLFKQEDFRAIGRRGGTILEEWTRSMEESSGFPDPLYQVLREGGPFHTRGTLPDFLVRLRRTGRFDLADSLERRHHDGNI